MTDSGNSNKYAAVRLEDGRTTAILMRGDYATCVRTLQHHRKANKGKPMAPGITFDLIDQETGQVVSWKEGNK